MKTFSKPTLALLPAALALLAPSLLPVPAQAGFLHKHPTAAGVGAGLIAHHMAKKGASSRMAHGKKPNLMERHPMATGILAGAAAHHMLKKH